jgi:hypothetical protein
MNNKSFTLVCPNKYPDIGSAAASHEYGKIAVIRTLRQLSGCGLREAKDISEITSTQTIGLIGAMNDSAVMKAFRLLERNGCSVVSPAWNILNELRTLATEALKQGEDELASEILQLVTAEKLRRNPHG